MLDPIQPNDLLTLEESAAVDQSLMTSKDKFLARVAIYSLRSLKQISADQHIPVDQISDQQVIDWVTHDPSLQRSPQTDASFTQFFSRIVLSSLNPLRQIAVALGQPIDTLTATDIITWFEQEAKRKISANNGS